MTETLGDDFLNGTKGRFYRPQSSTEIIKIIEFGSSCCITDVYDSKGRLLLKGNRIYTDQVQHYHRIPVSQVPKSLRQKESPLVQKAAQQPLKPASQLLQNYLVRAGDVPRAPSMLGGGTDDHDCHG